MSAILEIVALILRFLLPAIAKKREQQEQQQPREELLDFQSAATAGDDDEVNRMLHEWEVDGHERRRRRDA